MAARFALQQFTFHNSVSGQEEVVIVGASRDSVASQAFLETPAAFWSASPLATPAVTGVLAGYLAAYPNV